MKAKQSKRWKQSQNWVAVMKLRKEKVKGLKEPRIEYFSALDTQKRTATAVGVVGMPHVILIDTEGVVRCAKFERGREYRPSLSSAS